MSDPVRRRVLCLGYSVTELDGYVAHANALAARDEQAIEFVRSGWGGHAIGSIAFLIDDILDAAAPCSAVLLEIFTGTVRQIEPEWFNSYLDEILTALAERNMPTAFLNLYQEGIDYARDPLTCIAARYAVEHDIPLLDLATPLFAMGREGRGVLLRDGVHTTPVGGEIYGALVYAFMQGRDAPSRYVPVFRRRPRTLMALPVARLAPEAPRYALARNGIPLSLVEIEEGTELTLSLDRSYDILSVLLSCGPRSGAITFTDPRTGRHRRRTVYDAFCYYTRSIHISLVLPGVRTLTLRQEPGRPEVVLLKGEADDGPRIGRISHVCCRRPLDRRDRVRLLAWRARMAGQRIFGRIARRLRPPDLPRSPGRDHVTDPVLPD